MHEKFRWNERPSAKQQLVSAAGGLYLKVGAAATTSQMFSGRGSHAPMLGGC